MNSPPMLAWWLQKRLVGDNDVTSITGKPVENYGARLGWLTAPALLVFEGRTRRRQREAALAELSASGRLSAMVGLIDDAEGLAADRRDHAQAAARVEAIDRRLDTLTAMTGARTMLARRLGQEGVAAVALLALVYAVMTMVFA